MVTGPLLSPPAPLEAGAGAGEAPPTTAPAPPAPTTTYSGDGNGGGDRDKKMPLDPDGSDKGQGQGQCWERLLAGAGDDLLTCVFEFLQVAELATAARLSRACRNVTRGEELWRQVALRMWGRLMGQRPQPLLPDGGAASSLAYDPTTVGLGVPEMSFRDAVRSMVVTWPTQLDVSLMASEGLHKITVLSFGSAQPSSSSTSGSSSSSSSSSKDDASAGAAAAAATGGSWAARALEVVYAGYRLGSDRAVRADRPFPIRFPTLARHEGDGLSDVDEEEEEEVEEGYDWVGRWGNGKDKGGEEEDEEMEMAKLVEEAFPTAATAARAMVMEELGINESPQPSLPSGMVAVKGKGKGEKDEDEENKRPRLTTPSAPSAAAAAAAAAAQEEQDQDTKSPGPTSPMVQSPAPPVVPQQQQQQQQPTRPPPAPPVKPFTVLGSSGGSSSSSNGKGKAKGKPPGIAFHPSTIAYFEVTIGPPQPPAPDPNAPRYVPQARAQASCVAIGVGLVDFPLIGKQPGWDSRSYGYHGDDGQKYHSGGHGAGYGPTFGEGDTVGCGLVYFTPNELDRLTKLIKPKPTPASASTSASTTTAASSSSSTKAASAASASSARAGAGPAAASSSSAAASGSADPDAANAPRQQQQQQQQQQHQQQQGVGQPYGTAPWGAAAGGGGGAAGGETGGLAGAAMAAAAAVEAAGASDSDDSDSDEEAEDDVELFDPLTLFMRAVAAATQSTGRVFFTKNGQFLGFAFDNVALSQPLYPVVGLDSYHTVRVNFGGPSNAPGGRPVPFVFDVWGFQRELLGSEVADALLLGACRRSSYNVHPLHKDMHAGLAQCREAVGMMGVPLPSEMFAHPGDEEEEEEEEEGGDWWDMGDEDTDTNDEDYDPEDGGEEGEDEFDDDFDEEEEAEEEYEQDVDSLAGEAVEMGGGGGMEGDVGEEAPPLVGFQLAAVPYNQQQQQQQQQGDGEEEAIGGGGSN